jgi:hypothetical protein
MNLLSRLAAMRHKRMVDGRPVFNLTAQEAKSSTAAAMRVAQATSAPDATARPRPKTPDA